VLWLSLARRLPQDEIRVQLIRQLDAFEQQIGLPPAHVHGHHHVHQLSGVREIVVEVLRHRYHMETPYIRISQDMIHRVWHRSIDIRKCLMIGIFGPGLRTTLSGIASNEGFSGIYDFKEERLGLPRLFDRFLQCPGSRMLIMCHPGRSDPELTQLDSLTTQLAFLLSDEWPHLLAKNGIQLGRLRRLDERLPSNSRRSSPMSTTS
jgi:chitin disaccharide deacetylase